MHKFLKSRYWQVELDEESIPLTIFTIELLGVTKWVRIPFGLTKMLTVSVKFRFQLQTWQMFNLTNPSKITLETQKILQNLMGKSPEISNMTYPKS